MAPIPVIPLAAWVADCSCRVAAADPECSADDATRGMEALGEDCIDVRTDAQRDRFSFATGRKQKGVHSQPARPLACVAMRRPPKSLGAAR